MTRKCKRNHWEFLARKGKLVSSHPSNLNKDVGVTVEPPPLANVSLVATHYKL